MKAIEADQLVKKYKGNPRNAVDHLSLNIEDGEIYGLLGPNGAGKTTTGSMICGILKPDSGSIRIKGLELSHNFEKVKRLIGVVPQELALYPVLNAYQNLRFFGSMYEIPKDVLENRIEEYIVSFGLKEVAHRPIATYSGGMKRKVHLIAGILHDPQLVFLDEPTVGIDIQSKKHILDFLTQLHKKGTTIIYTSHNMEEAEQLCTTIGILHQGKMVLEGSPQKLTEMSSGHKKLESLLLHIAEQNSTPS